MKDENFAKLSLNFTFLKFEIKIVFQCQLLNYKN